MKTILEKDNENKVQSHENENISNGKAAFPAPSYQLKSSDNADDESSKESGQHLTASTGSDLPPSLQSNMEGLSGVNLDDVSVHRNSSEPAQLNAKAFAQGTDIHLGPGQEQHLPHEAWHVVQQKKGLVQPTTQLKGKAINADSSLENEAEMMGAKALKTQVSQLKPLQSGLSPKKNAPIQGFGLGDIGSAIGGAASWIGEKATDAYEYGKDRIGDWTNTRDNEAELDAQEDIEAFKSQFIYGPQDMTSSTGTGGFQAMYIPMLNLLNINVNAAVTCYDGLSIDGSNNITVNAVPYNMSVLQQAAADGNALPAANRAAFVSQFQFTADEKLNRVAQITSQSSDAGALWSGKHQFMVDKPVWRDQVLANVKVNFNVHEGAIAAGEHIDIKIVKTPDTYDMNAAVSSYGDVTAQHNDMTIDDSFLDVRGPTDGNLSAQILFADGSSDLATATGTFWGNNKSATDVLDSIANRWQDDKKLTPGNDADHNQISNAIRMIGRSSSTGSAESNRILAQARIDAVSQYLTAKGFGGMTDGRLEVDNQGETGATEDPEWRRVDLSLGSGEVQNTLAHEYGHVLGLDDEYVTGGGGTLGTKTSHSDLSEQIGGGISTHERNDSIMSNGNEVRGMHYSTFGEALRTLTNLNEWKLKS